MLWIWPWSLPGGLGTGLSPGNGVGAGSSLACCMVVLLKRHEGWLWLGEAPRAWWPSLVQAGAASQPRSWVQFLECRQHVLSTVGPSKDLVGKPPGKEEFLQEMDGRAVSCLSEAPNKAEARVHHLKPSFAQEQAVLWRRNSWRPSQIAPVLLFWGTRSPR